MTKLVKKKGETEEEYEIRVRARLKKKSDRNKIYYKTALKVKRD